MIRVLVVDDQEISRSGEIGMLRGFEDIEVVGEADSGPAAIEAVARLLPDVVLMDIRMPGGDGIQATRAITSGPHPAEVVALTTFDLDEYVVGAIEAGVSGFLLKDVSSHDLAAAIRLAASGEGLVSPKITRRMLAVVALHANSPSPQDPSPADNAKLSAREEAILWALVDGKTNSEIAQEMSVQPSTVKTLVSRMLAKLELKTRAQLVAWGFRQGMLK